MRCEICRVRKAEHRHHLFSQSKINRKLYGDNLLDDERNIIYVCSVCHLNKPIPKLTEREFCEMLSIEPRSKTEKMRED